MHENPGPFVKKEGQKNPFCEKNYFEWLRNKRITIIFSDGSRQNGFFTGWDVYRIFIRVGGDYQMFYKHALRGVLPCSEPSK